MTAEHFEVMLDALATVRLPKNQHHTPADCWRSLLLTLWVTGIWIGALLELRWDDVDLEAGIAISRAKHNKSKKDSRHKILAAVEVLRTLWRVRKPGESRIFPWCHDRTTLMNEFERLQQTAGIHIHCPGDHQHTPKCHVYGFHGFRYAPATYNYGRVTDAELQEQMGRASFQTTQRYIKYAKMHQERAYDVYLPESVKKAVNGG